MLRLELRQRLKALKKTARKAKDKRIGSKILRLRKFHPAEHLFFYVSKPEEVDTRGVIKRALSMGKKVYVPLVKRNKKAIAVCRIENIRKDLRRGNFGILEPNPRKAVRGRIPEFDIAFIPGLAFDRKGRRLGRGGGYFDRFLKRLARTEKVGLAYREQVLRRVPEYRNDKRVDRLLTD